MISGFLVLALMGNGPGHRTQDYHSGARSQTTTTSLSLLAPASVQSSPLFCTAARSLGLLSGSYSCLNGDGTQDSSAGMTLSAVGSPTTQTLATSPNGNNSTAVSRETVSSAGYFQGANYSPPGSFSACAAFVASAPVSTAGSLVSNDTGGGTQTRSFSLNYSSGAYPELDLFDQSEGLTQVVSTKTITGGAEHVECGTYQYVAAGTSIGTVYLDGVQVQQVTNAVGPIGSFTKPIQFGFRPGGDAVAKRVRGAFFTTVLLTPTQVAQLSAALIPAPQTASGVAVSNSRNSASWVTTSDGTLVALPPGRTGVVGVPGDTTSAIGGVVSSPSRTNLLTYSEQLDNAAWTKTTATVTANSTTAPDGALTADTVTSTSAGGYVSQAVTTSASAYDGGLWVRTTSGTQAGAVQLYDATAAAQACIATFTATTTYQRVSCATSTLTVSHSLQWRLYPGGTAGTGTVVAFGAQLETGSIASPYCRSESTSATCSGDVVTVTTPGWLSTREGCAKVCVTPTWTGANPSSSTVRFLYLNGGAIPLYTSNANSNVTVWNGTSALSLFANFTAGARRCYVTKWSASAGTMQLLNLTDGTASATAPFTGFSAFDSSLRLGNDGSGAQQPLGSIIDSITLGSSPGGCN